MKTCLCKTFYNGCISQSSEYEYGARLKGGPQGLRILLLFSHALYMQNAKYNFVPQHNPIKPRASWANGKVQIVRVEAKMFEGGEINLVALFLIKLRSICVIREADGHLFGDPSVVNE